MKSKFFVLFSVLMLMFGVARAEGTGEWFFRNNVSNDARLIELHMLGAHDAFTAGLNENSHQDDAGIKLGDSGATAAASGKNGEYDPLWKFLSLNMSRAQSADVDTLLNGGVRYFDVRLSRYQWGGEFYTVHGRVSDQFTGEGGIARKIASWAQNHPGEIVIIDFQTLFDIQTSDGGATQDSWRDLMSKLTADGVARYVYTNNGSISALTYGGLTQNGSRPAIVLFGQVTGANADSRFINRRDSDGYVRSNWMEQSDYNNLRSKMAEEIAELQNNSGSYFYKLRIMQAQTTSLNLINDANENNIKMLTDPDYDAWSELLPVLMVDNANTDSHDFNSKAVELLAKKNREFTPGVYRAVDGNYTLTGSNDNVPLGAKFSATRNADTLTLGGEINGKMTLIVKSDGKKQLLYKDGELLGETGTDGLLRAEIDKLGDYTLVDADEAVNFAVTSPLLRYIFTENLSDDSGNGLDAKAFGEPVIGGGEANLTPGNVIMLPNGLTKHMKEYTVTAWVNMNSAVSGSRLFDICRIPQASVFAHAGTDKTSSGMKNANTVAAEGPGLVEGKWTHMSVQYKNGVLTLYLNGEKIGDKNTSDPSPELIEDYFNNKGSFIGRTSWQTFGGGTSSDPDIEAKIADFRIYDSAVSPEEISRLARAPKKRFVDIDTGSDIMDPEEVDVPTAYSGVDFPETIGYYELVSHDEKITDLAGAAELVGYYRSTRVPVDSLTVARENGVAEAVLTLETERENVRLILAVYRDGSLVSAVLTDVSGTEAKLTTEAPDGTTIKAFLWEKDTLRPVMAAATE